MKASELRVGLRELRVGNYVHLSKEECQVQTVGMWLHTTTTVDEAPIERIHPIPLTEEWLVKFGFVKEKWADYCVYCDRPTDGIQFMLIGIVPQEQNMVNINGKWIKSGTIQYVHQLQNLYFALTGEELTVKENHPKSDDEIDDAIRFQRDREWG